MHFLQEELVYVSIVSKLCVIIGAGISAWSLPMFGAFWNLVAGAAAIAAGPLAFAVLPGQSGAYAKPLLVSVGSAMVNTAGEYS